MRGKGEEGKGLCVGDGGRSGAPRRRRASLRSLDPPLQRVRSWERGLGDEVLPRSWKG